MTDIERYREDEPGFFASMGEVALSSRLGGVPVAWKKYDILVAILFILFTFTMGLFPTVFAFAGGSVFTWVGAKRGKRGA